MTIITTQSRVTYAGDGVSTSFPIPFEFFLNPDITAVKTAVGGGQATLVQTVDYNLVGAGTPSGGTALKTTPLLTGETLAIFLNPPIEQESHYPSNNPFPAATLENDLDRQTQISQRLMDILSRSLRAPDGDPAISTSGFSLPSGPARANTFLTFDANGNPAVAVTLPGGTLSLASIVALTGAQTPSEAAASVVPVNKQYLPGNVLRYGTNTVPGTTDMTTAFNNALLSNGGVYVPAIGGPYLVAGQIVLQAGNWLYGDGVDSVLNFSSVANTDFIVGTNISGAIVSDLKLVATGVSTANNYQGVVAFRGCNNCRAQRLEVVGAYGDGIVVSASTNCFVEDNYLHGFQSNPGGNSDIHVMSTTAAGSSGNIVANNRCYGGSDFGIAVFQVFTVGFPLLNNRVIGNHVGQHNAYGILLYDAVITGVDTWNEVIGNYVENIQGTAVAGNSGAGIYVANQGGSTIVNNVVRNCCVHTSSATLVPGGISMANQAQQAPFTITGNSIYDMAQGNANGIAIAGIYIVNSNKGGTVSGNTVSQQVAGGITYGIWALGASNVQITGNNVNILNTIANTRGIYASSPNAAVVGNITINGNTVVGCAFRGIAADQAGSGTIANLAINGNNVSGWANAGIGVSTVSVAGITMNGNVVNAGAGTGQALNVSACTNMAVAGNTFVTSGATTIATAGACTNGHFDLSNYWNGVFNNAGTGFRMEFFFNASPATLGTYTFAVGDRAQQNVPVVGSPKGWLCTVAGTPGTWVSEGNL